tara:strand:- start:809 stop:1003 length:195 start_codon:yes stop_codon:yes gene_type:complete
LLLFDEFFLFFFFSNFFLFAFFLRLNQSRFDENENHLIERPKKLYEKGRRSLSRSQKNSILKID